MVEATKHEAIQDTDLLVSHTIIWCQTDFDIKLLGGIDYAIIS